LRWFPAYPLDIIVMSLSFKKRSFPFFQLQILDIHWNDLLPICDLVHYQICCFCLSKSNVTRHHVIPRSVWGLVNPLVSLDMTVPLCRSCHDHVHATFDNSFLAENCFSVSYLWLHFFDYVEERRLLTPTDHYFINRAYTQIMRRLSDPLFDQYFIDYNIRYASLASICPSIGAYPVLFCGFLNASKTPEGTKVFSFKCPKTLDNNVTKLSCYYLYGPHYLTCSKLEGGSWYYDDDTGTIGYYRLTLSGDTIFDSQSKRRDLSLLLPLFVNSSNCYERVVYVKRLLQCVTADFDVVWSRTSYFRQNGKKNTTYLLMNDLHNGSSYRFELTTFSEFVRHVITFLCYHSLVPYPSYYSQNKVRIVDQIVSADLTPLLSPSLSAGSLFDLD
jgi:hypothetical protein